MASLIGFDKNRENVEFKGHSKLSINFMSYYLYVEPENEEFKLISASFKWKYVMKKNLLFVFAEFDFMDFCLVFKNEQVCKKIYDYIVSQNNEISKSNSIDTSFIIPIFYKIAEIPILNSDLIEIIATWHHLMDEEEKDKYSNLMKEYGIYDLIMTFNARSQQAEVKEARKADTENRKRKFTQISKEKPENKKRETKNPFKNFTKIIPLSEIQLIRVPKSVFRHLFIYTSEQKNAFHEFQSTYISRSNKFQCVKCEKKAIMDISEDGKICVKMNELKHSCKPSTIIPSNGRTIKVIQKPEYEIYENVSNTCKKLLVVFDCANRNLCYEYYWSNYEKKFCCRGCSLGETTGRAKAALYNEGTEKEYVEILNGHVCQSRKYQSEKYQPIYDYLLKPNFKIQKFLFNGKPSQRLLVFDQDDKSQCYIYSYNYNKFRCRECAKRRHRVTAKLRQNVEGEEYIILSNTKHICEKRDYDPKKLHSSVEYVIKPNFEIQKFLFKNQESQKLVIFDKDDRTKCHYYSYHFSSSPSFRCNDCTKKGKGVSAKLCQNSKKEEFVILSNVKHVCEMKTYVSKIVLHPPEFEVVEATDKTSSKVIVFHKSDKCYVFNKNQSCFYCNGCYAKATQLRSQNQESGIKSVVGGHLFTDKETGKHSFQMNSNRHHICEPKPYLPKSYDFFYYRESDKPELLKLAIKHPDNKNLCFAFNYVNYSQRFYCCKCSSKTKYVLRVHKDAGGKEYYDHDSKKHVCEPIEISTIAPPKFVILKEQVLTFDWKPKVVIEDENKVIRTPNFELHPNKLGIPDRKLIIFDSNDRNLCYDFCFDKSSKYFKCNKCTKKNHYVSARLHKDDKNDEIFFILGNNEHICQPSQYQSIMKNPDESKIVKKPNFELRPNKAGIPDKQLILLHPKDTSLCYEYYFCNTNKHYKCARCLRLKMRVIAKLHKDDKNGEEPFIVLEKNAHVCEPQKYQPAKNIDESKIIRKPDFELRPNRYGVPDRQLFVFHPTDKTLCYPYSLDSRQSFKCNKCKAKKIQVRAKLLKDETNEEVYIEVNKNEHVCQPVKYQPL